MHRDNLARAGCTDCHGGDAGPMRDKSLAKGSPQFEQIQKQAHVQPTLDIWKDSAANPPEVWYQTIKETAEFIRFDNPGDLRIADASCGQCHAEEVRNVNKGMMRHGGMLWGAALYNNGSFPFKNTHVRRVLHARRTAGDRLHHAAADRERRPSATGILPFLSPLFRVAGDAARQHPAHLRARRHEAARDWRPRSRRKKAAGRGTA